MDTLTIYRQKEKRTFDYNIDLTFFDKWGTDHFDQSKNEAWYIWSFNIDIYKKTFNSNLFYLEKFINYSDYDNYKLSNYEDIDFKKSIYIWERALSYIELRNINYKFFLNSLFAIISTEQKLSYYLDYFNILSSGYGDDYLSKYFEVVNILEINDFLKRFNIRRNEIVEIGRQIKHFFKERINKIHLIYRKDYEEDFENLFIKIKTDIDFGESLKILNNFFREYWFKKSKKIKKYINIFLGFD